MKFSRALASVIVLLAASAGVLAQTYPPCSQDHPGHEHRAESLIKNGDASMARSAGGHAVLYAIERYGLKGYVTDADKDAAIGKMYDFLKWKMYSPANVAATWLADGYEHFDRAYVDEGAGMLLGLVVPSSDKPLIRIPKWFADHVMLMAGEGAFAAAVEEVLKQAGLPSPFAHDVATQMIEHFANTAIGDIQTALSFAMPRDFDIDNRFVELAVAAKKDTASSSGDGKTGGRPGGVGSQSGGNGSTSAENGSAGSGDTSAKDAKIAALETRVAELEKEIATLKDQLRAQDKGATGSKDAGAAKAGLKPVDSGYQSAVIEFRSTGGTTFTIKVNDQVIGQYDGNADVTLDDLLVKGFENHITVSYDTASPKVSTHATLRARMSVDKPWITVGTFSPKQPLEHTIDLPFKPAA